MASLLTTSTVPLASLALSCALALPSAARGQEDPGAPRALREALGPGPWIPFDEASSAPGALSTPPLVRAPAEVGRARTGAYDRLYERRMSMALGASGVMAAGLLPFTLAFVLHESWPCGGAECRGVAGAVGIAGLAGLSLFLFGAGATAYWATAAASALYGGRPPFGAIWMGRLATVVWAVASAMMALLFVVPSEALGVGGVLLSFVAMPLAAGQLLSTVLRRRARTPGASLASRPFASPEVFP